MNLKHFTLATTAALLTVAANPVQAIGTDSAADQDALLSHARVAVSENSGQAASAIEQLRRAGPAGLDALFQVHAGRITAQETRLIPSTSDAEWNRLRAALDAVGQQRDCHASRLYWHTDLDQAKAAARVSSKPILSLRLLGNLNEEHSCANSRFFRTTLYANAEVSKYLRDNFVLYWKSVRPAPRITIDFGDGRKIERTITGNSIHFVLDAAGRPIDALPGLYGPKTFLSGLARAAETTKTLAALSGDSRDSALRHYHLTRLSEIERQWQQDLAQAGVKSPLTLTTASSLSASAARADQATATKRPVEAPVLRETQPASIPRSLESLNRDAWARVAALYGDEARLDSASRRLIRVKHLTATQAMRLAMSKSIVEDPMLRVIQNLESSIAEDTVRNEYVLHSRIHGWFASGNIPADVDALNAKVYAELFLTPDSDPWLGLAPADVFAALDQGGLAQPVTKINR